MSEMKAKIGRRLTDEETKKAAVLAACIDASPHEWPEAVSEVALVCHGYLDQQARICELEAQLADARLDSARLDGLQKHHQHVNLAGLPVVECLGLVYHKNDDEWSCGNNVLGGWFRRKTLRAAIDAAMKEAK